MNTPRTLAIALAASLVAPLGAVAQTDQAGELASVATWEVEPSQFGTFLSIAAKVVQAANQAQLGQAYSWSMWHNFYTITLVGPFNRKELDDPNDWMKQFTGTPGEATLMEAFQEMERTGVQIRNSVNEIHQGVPAWTYEPAGMGQPPLAWVHVMEFWLKSGQQNEQAWNTLMGDFKTFFNDVSYPYPIWGNRVRYGDQRAIFVTAYDDPGAYHGDKGVQALAAKHNVADRWQSLIERVAQLTVRARDSYHEYLPQASYLGPAAPTGGQP